jgi:1-deoxy-D-xylulose-5-phosphate reductoisomerase
MIGPAAALFGDARSRLSSARLARRVAILGSTGSIGAAAVDVIRHLGPDHRATVLTAHRSGDKLLEQVQALRPAAVAITGNGIDETLARDLRAMGVEILDGADALERAVRREDVDVVLSAVVGAAGLPAAVAAIECGKPLLLANKESLVVAGELLVPEARRRGVSILPIDSEHSAIFQAMQCGRRDEIRRFILTASGGPFRTWSRQQIADATVSEAMNHPTWRMGGKITIDSATMFNKALEVIEAVRLFDLPPEQVQVLVHPESIVHSMVEFIDGSTIAQLSPPDMRMPIQYALTHPQRRPGIARRLDLSKSFTLRFEPPDDERFPALRIGFEVARRGGTSGAAMNAANEVAVEAFLNGHLRFGQIAAVVEDVLAGHDFLAGPTLEQLLHADRSARAAARARVEAARNPATV